FGNVSKQGDIALISIQHSYNLLRAPLLAGAVMLAALALPSIIFAAPQKQSAPRAVSSSLPAPVKSFGSPSAPIKLEVFSDFQCPSCRNFYEATLRPMIADYVAQGKVYLVNHDFPLQMHKYSGDAARWANAAAMIGQFGEVEGTLFDHQDAWEADGNIEKFVSQALSPSELKRVEEILKTCTGPAPTSHFDGTLPPLDRGCAVDPYIVQDIQLGTQIPVRATPTYVISYKGQKFPAGNGAVSWPIMKQFFDSLLSQ
ncbi:MAG: thioredoxin domain-containing protein, partial [Candidatus Acidiferrales bacterium]